MPGFDYSERPQAGKRDLDRAAASRRPTLAQAVTDLQRSAGNQAVGRLLARQPPAKVEAGFHGDRKHAPTDARYAAEIAKADIARLKDKWELSSDERADINAKLKWFQGAARDAYGAAMKPTLHQILEPIDMSDDPEVQREHAEWRSDRKNDINGLFNSIQKLKATRIDSWKENARLPESKLALAVLEAAIAIVSLGIGGVAYGLIEKMLEKSVAHKLLQEFVLLAGLEAADLAAEKAFHEAVELARADLETGRKRAQAKQKEDSKAALATKGDSIAAFTEAIRLQTITEETEEREAFNKIAKNMTDKELLAKYAALKLIYKQQLENPEPYIRQLTKGYILLLDEAMLSQKDKEHGGSRERTFKEDREAHQFWARPGNLIIWPLPTRYSLGHWSWPSFGFTGLMAQGTGVNKETLETLEGAPLKDLPLTIGISVWVQSPYLLWPGDRTYEMPVMFVRNPDGVIHVDGDGEAMEWLASYHTGQSREHSDDERERYAPLGASKLYERIKDKTITDTDRVRR